MCASTEDGGQKTPSVVSYQKQLFDQIREALSKEGIVGDAGT
jgi:hypothetical protein